MYSSAGVLPQSFPDTAGCAPVAYATRGHFLVSNPCCSPRFRTSASVVTQRAAFAVGVPFRIYEFDLYTRNSTLLYHTQVDPHSRCSMGKPWNSFREIGTPPTCPLRPVIPENACTPCLRLVRGFPRGSDYAFSSPPNLGQRKDTESNGYTCVCLAYAPRTQIQISPFGRPQCKHTALRTGLNTKTSCLTYVKMVTT